MRSIPQKFEPPRLMPTACRDETYAGVTYHIEGELVPSLTIELADTPVYFEHHILLWKESRVQIGYAPFKGLGKRLLAGMQVFVTEARGPGMVSFSRDGAGHIVPVHLEHGQSLDVREHQFLAATSNVHYGFARVRGISNLLFGGSGLFIDQFQAKERAGILWLHGYGNVFEKYLAEGETIDIEPGGWVYKDASVQMAVSMQNIATGWFSGLNFVLNRFTGPGRVGIQSMYLHMPTEN